MGDRVASAKGRYVRAHQIAPDQLQPLGRDLEFAKAYEKLEKTIGASPLPFTGEQRAALVRLIRSNGERP
jgi:hypothetical protein